MIQIAGVKNLREAQWIAESGATHIGFPLRLPVHKPDITEVEAQRIIGQLPAEIDPVLITYLNQAREIIEFVDFLKVKIVQLHGPIAVEELLRIKQQRADLFVIKSLIVRAGNAQELQQEVQTFSSAVSAFITDTFDPMTGASGATGKTHDWGVSAQLVQISPVPIILAGGLHHNNVAEAIRQVRPWGVDSHTGVEDAEGNKDFAKLKKFVERASQALQQF